MINLKVLKKVLMNEFGLMDGNIIIKRKKKMIIGESNGKVKAKRVNYTRIEIIEGGK